MLSSSRHAQAAALSHSDSVVHIFHHSAFIWHLLCAECCEGNTEINSTSSASHKVILRNGGQRQINRVRVLCCGTAHAVGTPEQEAALGQVQENHCVCR